MVMTISAEWHKANKMPKKPSTEERLRWHTEHMANCACRTPSPKLMQEIKKYEHISSNSS